MIPADLPRYIRELDQTGRLYKFYQQPEWLRLRNHVMEKCHYECQHCMKRGRVTRAKLVHHVNEVKVRPDLALSEFYTDLKTGERKENLVPLCQDCHNIEHDRIGEYVKPKPQLNEERW